MSQTISQPQPQGRAIFPLFSYLFELEPISNTMGQTMMSLNEAQYGAGWSMTTDR